MSNLSEIVDRVQQRINEKNGTVPKVDETQEEIDEMPVDSPNKEKGNNSIYKKKVVKLTVKGFLPLTDEKYFLHYSKNNKIIF